MTSQPNRRDLRASLFAATATLVTILLNGPMGPAAGQSSQVVEAAPNPMAGLITAEQAQTEGAWLLDEGEGQPTTRLSFAPQYDRLVWRVDGASSKVLIDAKTGEALEFQFD